MNSFYNAHTHVFNMDCAPEKFLRTRIANKALADKLHLLLQYTWVAKSFTWILKSIGSSFESVEKIHGFLKVGLHKNQQKVFEDLAAYYPAETKFVVLTLNMDHMGAGVANRNFKAQVDEIVQLRKRYPETCLPFLSMDPRMGSAEKLLKWCHDYIYNPYTNALGGFVGIKLYPALGFYPFDPNLDLVYEFAQQYQIPIMTHCTRGGVQAVEPDPLLANQLMPDFAPADFKLLPKTKNNNNELCDNFTYPLNYISTLKKFPQLKLCFAHYGGDDQIVDFDKNKSNSESWYKLVKEIILSGEFPNVYTDISYTHSNKKANAIIKQDLLEPILQDKIIFGTDYFMVLIEGEEDKMYTDAIADYGLPLFDKMSKENINNNKKITNINITNLQGVIVNINVFPCYLKSMVYQ